MLQYDLTNTPLFKRNSQTALPTEAETFIITIAMLLAHNSSYSDLRSAELELKADRLEDVAIRIEHCLRPLIRDIGSGRRLRRRLRHFVGLRISDPTVSNQDGCQGSL